MVMVVTPPPVETVVDCTLNERTGKLLWQGFVPPIGLFGPRHTDRKVPTADSPEPRLTPSMPQNLFGIMNAGVPTPEP